MDNQEQQGQEDLPKLSAAEFQTYNAMAERMELFHNHFRQSWTTLYDAAKSKRRPSNLSLSQFIRVGTDLCSQLETHHLVEERHIFPLLAKRMPVFSGHEASELIGQHRQIHEGLEQLEKYLSECRGGKTELRMEELKAVMDGFGKVLWQHLDDEVRELGAENMRKFWSLEDMKKMPT